MFVNEGAAVLGMDLSALDFTESVVTDVKFALPFRDLVLRVEYYWDLDNPESNEPGPGDALILRFRDCAEICWSSSAGFFKVPGEDVSPDAFTIVGWRDEADPASGLRRYTFQSSHSPERSWLEVVCRELDVERAEE